MSTNDQQLISDHKKVIDTIALYKNIKLISTSGEPPDEYDIEYKLRGYSNISADKVKITKQHRVKIKIPFGYPHFPPTVQPLSSIFHPDIDAHVVRIADYWENNKSLADLVVHFGEMICGQVYSSENPFNKKAAAFFQRHKDSLPLDSLEIKKDEPEEVVKHSRPSIEFNIPIFKILFTLLFIVLLGGGGLYFFEKNRLEQAQETFKKAEIYKEDQEFKKAHDTGQKALADLQNFFLLRSPSDQLTSDINGFLQEQSLQEGLKGKTAYKGKYISIEMAQNLELLIPIMEKAKKYADQGNTQEAIATYEEALAFANKYKITVELDKIEQNLAGLRLKKLILSAEKAHKSKNWQWSVKEHKKVLAFIKENEKHLEDGAQKKASKIRYLLMLDQIAFYSQKASKAEARGDLPTALKNYNALIDYIGKSGSRSNATLKKTLVEAMQKAAIITEKLVIIQKREWLLKNYKEIFPIHYPNSVPAALRNPQAIFVRYEGKNLLYTLSCLEKGQGSVVKLKVHYQYNPETQQWSIFSGEI